MHTFVLKKKCRTMRATLEYIKQKFDEYNHQMFEGKLKPLPFKLSNAKSFLGAMFFQRKRNADGTWHYDGFVLKISTVLDLPEEVVEDTIIHEMIHYYIMSNQMQDTAPHGKLFTAKMQEINRKFNRNLSVAHRTTKEEQESDKRVRQHIVCVSRLKTGKCGVTVATKSRLLELWHAMPRFPQIAELKWMVTTDPYFNRFRKATKPGIYIVPSEELEPHLKDAKELIKQSIAMRDCFVVYK